MKRISVVMATYNGDKYLEKQIQSILDQTLKPAEIIVCDDVSTDGTVAILEKYKQAGQLTYLVNEERLGLVKNFKKAVLLADDANYISLADQDDEWAPDKLEQSTVLLEKIDDGIHPCMVYTDLMLIDINETILNKSFRNELGQDKYQHNLQSLLFNNFVTGCTMLMNQQAKPFFAEIPNDTRFHDEWMALMVFTFGSAGEIKLPLVRYRKHENNMSMATDAKPRDRYTSTFKQLLNAVIGKDDFLVDQFKVISRFYTKYDIKMSKEAKAYFEQFLSLQNKPYLAKKAAFRSMVKKFTVKT